MLRILIVDDEPPARRRLRRMLGAEPGVEVAGEAASGEEAMERIAALRPDMLLLDISMPGLDGMSLARTLKAQQPAPSVVFCTAFPDRALDAFDCDAVDYLVKPVRAERLQVALSKVRKMAGPSAQAALLRSKVGGRTELVELRRVICLLAEDKYTKVIHTRGETVINDTLVELEKSHPGVFLRIHRNALVALERIRGLEQQRQGGAQVILDGTMERPDVSRRNLPAVRQAIRELT